MKTPKTEYMVLHEGKIVFPNEVTYLEKGFYLCKTNLSIFTAFHPHIVKLSAEYYDELIRNIHRTVYGDAIVKVCHFKTIEGYSHLNVFINKSGQIECDGYYSNIFMPKNCMKWEYSKIVPCSENSYLLKQCDEVGSIAHSRKCMVNPFSNNCNTVYNTIRANPEISTSEIIDLLGWPPNSVTSRLSELMGGGRIVSVGRVLNPKSGRKVHKWKIAY